MDCNTSHTNIYVANTLTCAHIPCTYTLTPYLKGQTGAMGEKGEKGSSGQKGDLGETGLQGAVGLIGPKGDRGFFGRPGRQGDKGNPGDQGVRGPPGSPGPRGPPVRSREVDVPTNWMLRVHMYTHNTQTHAHIYIPTPHSYTQHVHRAVVEVMVPLEIWGYQEPMGLLVHQVTLGRTGGQEPMDTQDLPDLLDQQYANFLHLCALTPLR